MPPLLKGWPLLRWLLPPRRLLLPLRLLLLPSPPLLLLRLPLPLRLPQLLRRLPLLRLPPQRQRQLPPPPPVPFLTLTSSNCKKLQNTSETKFTDSINSALTAEHLESEFYKQGFAKFPASDFKALGLSDADVTALQQVGATEATHVSTLLSTIASAGTQPVAPCEYNFGFTDAAGMIKTARILEAVGVSAYVQSQSQQLARESTNE